MPEALIEAMSTTTKSRGNAQGSSGQSTDFESCFAAV